MLSLVRDTYIPVDSLSFYFYFFQLVLFFVFPLRGPDGVYFRFGGWVAAFFKGTNIRSRCNYLFPFVLFYLCLACSLLRTRLVIK